MSNSNQLSASPTYIDTTYFQGTLRTPPFIIPAGKTSFFVYIFISTSAGAVGNVYYSNLKMVPLQATT